MNRRNLVLAIGSLPMMNLNHAISADYKISGIAKLVIGFPPGNLIDNMARVYANFLTGKYADKVIVENKPGADGRIAMEYVKNQPADGRCFILVPDPVVTLYPHVYSNLKFSTFEDFKIVAGLSEDTMGLALGKRVPQTVNDIKSFEQWVKNYKETIFFSANSRGSGPHIMALRLAKKFGVNFEYVPYHGGALASNALLAGDIHFNCLSLSSMRQIASNKEVRIIGFFSDKRNPNYENVPTFKESGFEDLVQYEIGTICVPSKTPGKNISNLESSLRSATSSEPVKKSLAAFDMVPTFRSSNDAELVLKESYQRYKTLIPSTGVKLD